MATAPVQSLNEMDFDSMTDTQKIDLMLKEMIKISANSVPAVKQDSCGCVDSCGRNDPIKK